MYHDVAEAYAHMGDPFARQPGDPSPPEFLFGLDLGCAADFSVLTVIEQSWDQDDRWQLDVRDALKYPLRTSYPKVVENVKRIVESPACRPLLDIPPPGDMGGPIRRIRAPRPRLVIDGTGVGEGIVELFIAAGIDADLIPVKITGGTTASKQKWPSDYGLECFNVAKVQLVAALQAALQTGRLLFAPEMNERRAMIDELAKFTKRTTPKGNETFAAERDHDDVVMSLAIAVWVASRPRDPGFFVIPDPWANVRW
jgi:hypothetical protein